MDNENKKFSPILPFDSTFGENYNMYDSFPYKKNPTIIGDDAIRLESGNVYKNFLVLIEKPCNVGGDR